MSHPFIGRQAQLARFRDLLRAREGALWPITGGPGLGKTYLLRECMALCEEARRPYLVLDLDGLAASSGQEVLAALAAGASSADGLPHLARALETLDGAGIDPFAPYDGAMAKAEAAAEGEAKAAATAVAAGLEVLRGLIASRGQRERREAAKNPELFLLGALGEAAGQHAVVFVDAHEHARGEHVRIRTDVSLASHQPAPRTGSEATQTTLAPWLDQSMAYLVRQGALVVVAGRVLPASLGELETLPDFDREELGQVVASRPQLEDQARDPAQRRRLTDLLERLSFGGNPLWAQVGLSFVVSLVEDGEDLAALAGDPGRLQACFEDPGRLDPDVDVGVEHGACKLVLMARLTSHVHGLEDRAWRIALPRELDHSILRLLFGDQVDAVTNAYTYAGVFAGGHRRFRLHEEVRDLLLAYARHHGLLYDQETLALQRALKEHVLAAEHGTPAQCTLEACYHTVMADPGLREKGVDPEELWRGVGGSSLTVDVKRRIVEGLPGLSGFPLDLEGLMKALKDEARQLAEIMGSEPWNAISTALADGTATELMDIDYWQRRVEESGAAGDWLMLADSLNEAERQEDALDAYQTLIDRFADRDQPAVREQVANAMVNLGITLGQLDRPEEALAAYQALKDRFADSDQPVVREQVARAMNNRGFTLEKLGRLDEAASAYQECLDYAPDNLDALANDAELALLQGEPGRCLARCAAARSVISPGDEEYVILPFFAALAGPEAGWGEVLAAIDGLEGEVAFTWDFADTAPVLAALPSPRREQAQALVDFFAGRMDRAALGERLAGGE